MSIASTAFSTVMALGEVIQQLAEDVRRCAPSSIRIEPTRDERRTIPRRGWTTTTRSRLSGRWRRNEGLLVVRRAVADGLWPGRPPAPLPASGDQAGWLPASRAWSSTNNGPPGARPTAMSRTSPRAWRWRPRTRVRLDRPSTLGRLSKGLTSPGPSGSRDRWVGAASCNTVPRERVAETRRRQLDALDLRYPLALDTSLARSRLGYAEVVDPEEAIRLTIADELSRS